jgi:hypothetical protein
MSNIKAVLCASTSYTVGRGEKTRIVQGSKLVIPDSCSFNKLLPYLTRFERYFLSFPGNNRIIDNSLVVLVLAEAKTGEARNPKAIAKALQQGAVEFAPALRADEQVYYSAMRKLERRISAIEKQGHSVALYAQDCIHIDHENKSIRIRGNERTFSRLSIPDMVNAPNYDFVVL